MQTKPNRILCVDDDADTCAMLAAFLSQYGYETDYAGTLEEGLEKAESGVYSLYLLDLWVRGSKEWELCRCVRELDAITPIIVYSADARKKHDDKLTELNVQAYLVKPRGLDSLVETVNRLLAKNYSQTFS
ncbi:MAG: response regulator [Pyrinomonadaceae bacterium]|nr:response regulator [Pyrinomonadaceae bacterium]